MSDWQPIETAPKDGTEILGFGIWQGEVNGVDEFPTIDIIYGGPTARTDYDARDGWWLCKTGDAYACWLLATHWMPLPEPPTQGATND